MRGKNGIQLQVRHLYLGTAKQVCLCELGMLPAPHQQPGKHGWRSMVDCSSQGETNTWSAEHVSVLSPDCSLCQSILTGQRRHFLMTVHPDIFSISGFTFALIFWVLLSWGLEKAVCGDGAPTKIGRYCPELLHREAGLHKSELNYFPDCVRGVPEFLGG